VNVGYDRFIGFISTPIQRVIQLAKMAEGQDSQKKISVTVKTTKEKQNIEIEEDASVKDVSYCYVKELLHLFQYLHTFSLTQVVARQISLPPMSHF
jgi:hypothetical protein